MPRAEPHKYSSQDPELHLSVKGGGFECTLCNKRLKRKGDWKRHLEIHQDPRIPRRFKCDQPGCGFTSHQRNNYNTHLKTHTKKKDKICTWPCVQNPGGVCIFRCTDPSSLNRHIKRHIKHAMEEGETIPEDFLDLHQRIQRKEHGTIADACSSRKKLHPSNSSKDVKEVPPLPVASSSKGSSTYHVSPLHADSDSGANSTTPWTHDSSSGAFIPESRPSGYDAPLDGSLSLLPISFNSGEAHFGNYWGHLHEDVAQFVFSYDPDFINDWLAPKAIVPPESEHHVLHSTLSDSWGELCLLMQKVPLLPSTPTLFSLGDIDYTLSHQTVADGELCPPPFYGA